MGFGVGVGRRAASEFSGTRVATVAAPPTPRSAFRIVRRLPPYPSARTKASNFRLSILPPSRTIEWHPTARTQIACFDLGLGQGEIGVPDEPEPVKALVFGMRIMAPAVTGLEGWATFHTSRKVLD